jgi:hypothetical protein
LKIAYIKIKEDKPNNIKIRTEVEAIINNLLIGFKLKFKKHSHYIKARRCQTSVKPHRNGNA